MSHWRTPPAAVWTVSHGPRFFSSSNSNKDKPAEADKQQKAAQDAAKDDGQAPATAADAKDSKDGNKEDGKEKEEPPKRHIADWMDMMMPERNWGLTNPRTWVLIAAVIVLQIYLYNLEKDRADEQLRKDGDTQAKLMNRRHCRRLAERLAERCNRYAESGDHCADLSCLRAMIDVIDNDRRCVETLPQWPPVNSLHNAIGACGGPLAQAEIRARLDQEAQELLADSAAASGASGTAAAPPAKW